MTPPSSADRDRLFMEQALAAAREADAPYGALVARGDTILAVAGNATKQRHDATAHAEVQALRLAGAALQTHNLAGTTLYATAEPCPMCAAAALWAGVSRIVYGVSIDELQRLGQRQIELTTAQVVAAAPSFASVTVEGGLCAEEAQALFKAAQ
ncbi:MAG: nucleoside deaminase [Bacteroidota bacterium]